MNEYPSGGIQEKYWTYKPGLIPSFVFKPLLEIITEYCSTGESNKRISCVFSNIHKYQRNNNYGKIPHYEWSDAPSILYELCNMVEDYTKEKYDYVLVHIYINGKSSIGYHNDSEALNSSIASVSLGATRKFRFKKITRSGGWDTELELHDGDLVWMHGPDPLTGRPSCQREYFHTVPIERKVKEPRINLTFRQYE